MVSQVQRRFLDLMAAGDQTCHQVDREIRPTAVTNMPDLGNVFQLVVNRLQDSTPTPQYPVTEQHQAIA